ncbi:ComF family protein [Maridesulfovibrio ferrireducens]|uniref:ComF family protein n=1 Tax=Maridesulfovibrio ferrireducens TaxID=246191 RepID=UPI001A20929E|nr:ComF family protein [Maridesulfovibrio ferrireducens]MBI9109861.1 ComF family protein [Maridesulfovibrio ferrireducens]
MISGFISYFSPIAAFDRLRSIFTEKRCPICRTPHSNKKLLCPDCYSELIEGSVHDEEEAPHKGIYFYGPYRGLLRDLILDWKFNNNFGYSALLSQFATGVAESIPESSRPDIIIPVPLHPSRLRKRGFNQSRIIGRSAASVLGAKISDRALVRNRKTTPQSTLSKEMRTENIKNAFTANPATVAGKKILLIDDVYTTGSTVQECASTLYDAGAERVEVLVLAKTLI